MKTSKLTKIYPHIEKASEAVLDRLKKSRKTCVIMPTGTGKTMVSSVVIENLGVKTMYLCPNNYILDQTKEKYQWSGIESRFTTYPDLMSRIKSGDINYFSGIDLFILDEFHRLGSEVWGESWKTVEKKFPESKILGLTATETRYLDGGRDMAKELFQGDISYELTLSGCFNEGILRAPKYVIAADITSTITEMEDKVNVIKNPEHKKEVKEMIKNLRHNWIRTKGLAECYRKYILENPSVDFQKMIVFHERISEADDIKKLVAKNLRDAGYQGGIKFYTANSENPESLEEIRGFNKDSYDGIKILLSVNMCNEGLHVEGCSVEVQYRSTTSKNVYLQQIGRIMSLGCKTQPVILDLVQNVSLSNGIIDINPKDPRSRSGKCRDWGDLNLPEEFEIINTTLDYQKVCEMLDEERHELSIKCKQLLERYKTDGLFIVGLE